MGVLSEHTDRDETLTKCRKETMSEFKKANLLLESQETTSYEENLSFQYGKKLGNEAIPEPFQGEFVERP
jgi:hypothetical protein